MSPIVQIRERLQGVSRDGRSAKCPAHEDRRASLSIGEGEDGKALLKCHAGCSFDGIIRALGLDPKDLFPTPTSDRRIVEMYDYRDERSELLFQVVRYEPKDFRQRRPDGAGGWINKLQDVRRVLYRLPELLAAPTRGVFLVEGEKDADALVQLGLLATTNPGGAGKWRAEYNEALRNRSVCIIPDHDDAGEGHARHVARELLPVARDVRVVRLPGLSPKGDVSDWLAAGGTGHALKLLVKESKPVSVVDVAEAAKGQQRDHDDQGQEAWPAPLALDAPHARAVFPVEALPSWAACFVREVSVVTQTPPDLAGMLALAALALAVQRKFELRVGQDWLETLSLYVVVALPPGDRKTAVVQRVAAPIHAHERDANDALEPVIRDAEQRRRIAEKRLDQLEKKAASASVSERGKALTDATAARQDLESINVPVRVVELADDVTVERLAQLLVRNGERIGVISDEGGLFDAIAGRYGGKSDRANLDLYLKGHVGSPHRVERIGRAPDYLQRPAITLGLAVQPAVLEGLAANPSFRGRGLTARFLYAVPRSTVGSRQVEPSAMSLRVAGEYAARLRTLLASPAGETPLELQLEPAARRALLEYARNLEPRLGEGGDLRSMADWAGKLTGALARVAAIRHCAEHAGQAIPAMVGLEHVEAAIALGDYLVEHARAGLGLIGADPALGDARRTLRAAQMFAAQSGGSVTRAELHSATKLERRRLDAAVGLLAEYGWLRSREPEKTGGRPLTRYDIHPAQPCAEPMSPDEKVEKVDKPSEGEDRAPFSTFLPFSPKASDRKETPYVRGTL